ncbi:MAG: 2-oxo acid dehydrogenase subunit E2 [Spirochaetaceae bacterium]|nr:2-oxo acid dehydrogenase subunit E2 [Spirochaetaceae bacterium]
MASEVLLPKQGNTVESCIILEWKKAEGDAVAAGEPIVEVETDKATFDVESTADGVLLSRLVSEGDDVPVLSPIAIIGEPGEKPATDRAPAATHEPATTATPTGPAPAPAKHTEPSGRGGRAAISPRARRLADQNGIAYANLTGSGPDGRIMVQDVKSALDNGASGTADAASYDEIPVKGIRKVIAERMHASLTSTAQFTMNAGADARRLLEHRARLKASATIGLQSISINDLVMFAVSRALPGFPAINATFSDGVIRRYGSVNLGFAVDTERGLMVPVIKEANQLTLVQLAAEAHRLAEACKAMKAGPEDLSGGTFSVTNLGAFGIQSFTPVLDAPQVGILGIGAIELKPVMVDRGMAFVPTLSLSLTIDHQVVDGAPAARFLKDLAGTIAEIDLTLAQ